MLEMLAGISFVSGQHFLAPFHHRPGFRVSRSPQRLDAQVKTAHLVADNHVEWRGRRSLLHETTHVKAFRVGAPVDDCVDRPLIAVKGKDDWLVCG